MKHPPAVFLSVRLAAVATRATRVLLGLAAASAGWGQSTNALPANPGLPDVAPPFLRMMGAVALVLALFFAGVWLFQRSQRLLAKSNRRPKLAVLENRSLSNRHAIYVVGYERQRLLVGCSPAGVSLISPLPEAEAETPGPKPAAAPFTRALREVLQRP